MPPSSSPLPSQLLPSVTYPPKEISHSNEIAVTKNVQSQPEPERVRAPRALDILAKGGGLPSRNLLSSARVIVRERSSIHPPPSNKTITSVHTTLSNSKLQQNLPLPSSHVTQSTLISSGPTSNSSNAENKSIDSIDGSATCTATDKGNDQTRNSSLSILNRDSNVFSVDFQSSYGSNAHEYSQQRSSYLANLESIKKKMADLSSSQERQSSLSSVSNSFGPSSSVEDDKGTSILMSSVPEEVTLSNMEAPPSLNPTIESTPSRSMRKKTSSSPMKKTPSTTATRPSEAAPPLPTPEVISRRASVRDVVKSFEDLESMKSFEKKSRTGDSGVQLDHSSQFDQKDMQLDCNSSKKKDSSSSTEICIQDKTMDEHRSTMSSSSEPSQLINNESVSDKGPVKENSTIITDVESTINASLSWMGQFFSDQVKESIDLARKTMTKTGQKSIIIEHLANIALLFFVFTFLFP